jgi:hypothetical protein
LVKGLSARNILRRKEENEMKLSEGQEGGFYESEVQWKFWEMQRNAPDIVRKCRSVDRASDVSFEVLTLLEMVSRTSFRRSR